MKIESKQKINVHSSRPKGFPQNISRQKETKTNNNIMCVIEVWNYFEIMNSEKNNTSLNIVQNGQV